MYTRKSREFGEQSHISKRHRRIWRSLMSLRTKVFFLTITILAASQVSRAQQPRFHLQEATIDDVHRAIRQGQITCSSLVKLYLNRAKAYNGVSNQLVTQDG